MLRITARTQTPEFPQYQQYYKQDVNITSLMLNAKISVISCHICIHYIAHDIKSSVTEGHSRVRSVGDSIVSNSTRRSFQLKDTVHSVESYCHMQCSKETVKEKCNKEQTIFTMQTI
jgi:hypothetical protein